MIKIIRLVPVLLSLTWLPALSADTAATLARVMGDSYQAAGIEKLGPEEQAALLAWLEARDTSIREQVEQQAVAEAQKQAEARIEEEVAARIEQEKVKEEEEKKNWALRMFGLEKPDPDQNIVIESSIKGRFTGWMGSTLFYLDNGHVWRQRTTGKYYNPVQDPKVIIRKESMGYWMEVVETGARVGVERVQ
jgi:hypothetical protein